MLKLLIGAIVFIAIGASAGYFSAQTAITYGLGIAEIKNGPWAIWPSAGSSNADPYTRAHVAWMGEYPLTSFEAVTFRAFSDQAGDRLNSKCDYIIDAQAFGTRWWNITLYSKTGKLIDNPADRYSFNSDNVILAKDSSFKISLSQEAQTGNWIPMGQESGPVTILLRLFGPGQKILSNLAHAKLPQIKKDKCR